MVSGKISGMLNPLLYIDAGAVAFILFAALIVAAFAAIPVILSVIIFRWLSRRGYRKIAIIVLLAFYSFIAYNIYTAIFPTDDFYYDEFRTVTLKPIPKSAVIVKKTASYPDFHGDYTSVSLIKLSKQDYRKLLSEIRADKRLHKGEIIGSSELDETMGKQFEGRVTAVFNRTIPNESDHYLTIMFLNDAQSIVVYVSVT
jgi:hypothetical protein